MTDFRNRSLDLEPMDHSARGGIWTVVGDLALSLVLVLVLFVLAQFLHYEKVSILDEIERRRQEVAEITRAAAADVLNSSDLQALTIESHGFTAQRIRFPEAMLFGSCEVVPREDGARLIEAVGRALGGRIQYFESVQIEGHADRRPPSGACERLVRDNWGLASMRATEFVRILARENVFGTDSIVSAVGRGDTQPLTTGSVPVQELERDRRVELVLIYSEANALNALGVEGGSVLLPSR